MCNDLGAHAVTAYFCTNFNVVLNSQAAYRRPCFRNITIRQQFLQQLNRIDASLCCIKLSSYTSSNWPRTASYSIVHICTDITLLIKGLSLHNALSEWIKQHTNPPSAHCILRANCSLHFAESKVKYDTIIGNLLRLIETRPWSMWQHNFKFL